MSETPLRHLANMEAAETWWQLLSAFVRFKIAMLRLKGVK